MIRKTGYRFFLATNAKRLRGDHAQTKRSSATTFRRKVIRLQPPASGSLAGSAGNQWIRPIVDTASNFAVNDMSADDRKRAYRNDLVFATMLVTLGLVISGLSLTQLTV